MMRIRPSIHIAVVVVILGLVAHAQEDLRTRGTALYGESKYSEAALMFEDAVKQAQFKSDAQAWNFLGLSYFHLGNMKKARKALEKAVELQPKNGVFGANLAIVYLYNGQKNKAQKAAEDLLRIEPSNSAAMFVMGTAKLWEGDLNSALSFAENAIAVDPGYAQAYILKSDVFLEQIGRHVIAGSKVRDEIDVFRKIVETLETGLEKSKTRPGAQFLREKLEGSRAFYEHFKRDKAPDVPAVPDPGVTPLKILSKPKASFTDEARTAGVNGTVRLVVLLGADGKVQQILKIKGLGYGLDEQAIKAARQIKFEPKTKDGKPVPTVVTIEYNFEVR